MGRALEPGIPTFGIRRFGIYTARTTHIRGRNDNRSNEELVVTELGQVGTQFDGLAHITIGGLAYNCYDTLPTDRPIRTGFDKLGIEKVSTIFTCAERIVYLQTGGEPLVCRISADLKVGMDETVGCRSNLAKIFLFDPQSGLA